jgi:hypothetical protein
MKKIHCNYNNFLPFLLLITLLSFQGHAQEKLTGTGLSHRIKSSKEISSANDSDTLSIPFIEDFSRGVGYPFEGLWMDDYAYVNYQYPVNPPSIGVVTLDALNQTGEVYPNGSTSAFKADKLTSKPINLDLQPSDSVYLSFYYQSGGRGDTSGGEFQDSLVLQYYSADSSRWESVWSVSYSEEDTLYERHYHSGNLTKIYTDSLGHRKFYQTLVPVRKARYLNKGFQFRFMNYASLSDTNEIPSRAGNVDQWHLDFIRLDKNRTYADTIINDIAFVKPLSSLLMNYESLPWDHFPDANAYEMDNSLSITYRNLGDKVWNISREFAIIDKMGDNVPFTFTGGTGDDIPPFTKETYPRSIDYIFPYNDRDSALFKIVSYMVTDTASARAPYRWNDTLQYFQKFYNYYAYDDGTAENGYGIPGEGSQNAMVAFRFRSYTPDTLQAIQIYFNQTLNDASQNSFQLRIWEDNNGKPGRLIYEQEVDRPTYKDSVNQFHNYVLKDKPYLEEGYFFVGYQKYNTEMLNVGFDVNNINNDKLFFNIDGQWKSSGLEGTIMIRPVFGDYLAPVETDLEDEPEPEKSAISFDIYPMPVRDQINIKLDNGDYHNYTYSIYDIRGRTMVKGEKLNRTINLPGFSSGLYILKLRNRVNGSTAAEKFVISR